MQIPLRRYLLAFLASVFVLSSGVSPASADLRTEARRHFRRGMALIEQGDLRRGIDELQLAYETLPHHNVLFNIARAYVELGEYPRAIDYYEQYLQADVSDREEVQGYVAILRSRLRPTSDIGDGTSPPDDTPTSPHELQPLERSAEQLEALAEAVDSEALRQRARDLRALAEALASERTLPREAITPPPPSPGTLELGEERDEDVYEERVVSASRYPQSPLEAPNAVYTITRQDIRLSGITNIGELLRRVPGVDVMNLSSNDLNISARGFNQRLANRILVLVNGRSVYLDALGTTFYSILPFGVEDIERIEFIRGPASALYGADAFSGVINIITRSPGEAGTEVVAGAGNDGQAHAYVSSSGRAGRLGYRLSAGFDRAERFTLDFDSERVDIAASTNDPALGHRVYRINAGLDYRLSEDFVARLEGGHEEGFITFQAIGPLRDFFSDGSNSYAMATLEHPWGQFRGWWSHLNTDVGLSTAPVGGDPLLNNFVSHTVDLEASLAREFHLGVDHNLHVGVGYRLKTIGWDYLDDFHRENHFSFFAQDTLSIIEPLSLVLGFRIDIHPLLDEPVFSPRGAILVHPTENSTIRTTVGTAFRTQTFLETYLDLEVPSPIAGVDLRGVGSEVSGRELDPESILSVEVGYRNEESEYFVVDFAAYYNRIQDLVVLQQVRPYRLTDLTGPEATDDYSDGTAAFPLGTFAFENDPTVFDVAGGEISSRVYPVRGLDIYANYAFNRAFVRRNEGTGRESEGRTSTHKFNLGVQYRSSFGLDVAVDFHWVSDQAWLEQQFDPVQGIQFQEFALPAYHLLNARIGYRLLDDRLDVGVAAYNLTNHRHRQHPFGQQLSLRVLGTVGYRF